MMFFLLGKTEPNYLYLEKRQDIKKNELKNELLKKVNDLDFKALSSDADPFLIDLKDRDRILDFVKYIKNKI